VKGGRGIILDLILTRIERAALDRVESLDKQYGRCSVRVGREVLFVMRFEQRELSWPHYPSEREVST
jgi:hypothetical protein